MLQHNLKLIISIDTVPIILLKLHSLLLSAQKRSYRTDEIILFLEQSL